MGHLFAFVHEPLLLQVNLRSGVPSEGRTDTCTAGAGSLLVEFGILSKLLGDPTYHLAARRANRALWGRRHNMTGLMGELLLSLKHSHGIKISNFYHSFEILVIFVNCFYSFLF